MKKRVWIALLVLTVLLLPWTIEFTSILILGSDMDMRPIDQAVLLVPVIVTIACIAVGISLLRDRKSSGL